MSIWKKIIPSRRVALPPKMTADRLHEVLAQQPRRRAPTLPPPTPQGTMRVHIFAGTFPSWDAATAYCFGSGTAAGACLDGDLPDAWVDTNYVAVRHGPAEMRLDDILSAPDAARMTERIGDATTVVLIREPAFGGLAYALNDTPCLHYLGPLVIRL